MYASTSKWQDQKVEAWATFRHSFKARYDVLSPIIGCADQPMGAAMPLLPLHPPVTLVMTIIVIMHIIINISITDGCNSMKCYANLAGNCFIILCI